MATQWTSVRDYLLLLVPAHFQMSPLPQTGAVGCLNGVRDAISAARLVMEKTYHTLIVGRDATTFALQNGLSAQSTSSVESSSIWATWFAAGKVPNYRRSASVSSRESAHLHPDRGHDTIGQARNV